MTDWRVLLRPQLIDLGPYLPGPSIDELRREYDLDDVLKLNWNEGLFGPLPGVLEALARELDEAGRIPSTPTSSCASGSPARPVPGPVRSSPGTASRR
jgi:histidinol-phosphate aminotransferase